MTSAGKTVRKWAYIDDSMPGSPVAMGFSVVPYEAELPAGYVHLLEGTQADAHRAGQEKWFADFTGATKETLLGTVHKPADESYRF